MGHRRLAVLDLSERAAQPMWADGHCITYNGEIYNHVELRVELERCGYSFSTRSDTEVLLNAYRHWGEACLARLNGIFAFALWDPVRRVLFAARDRLGVKPLYYISQGGRLGLASEIRALRAVFNGFRLDQRLVRDFLVAGRLEHTEQTFFAPVKRLPAGCFLRLRDGRLRVERYWAVRVSEERAHRSLAENTEEFAQLLEDSVRIEMRADVPVGCCLSGGLDSTSVAALASLNADVPVHMFTARYRHASMDEWRYAQALHAERDVVAVAAYAEPGAFWSSIDDVLAAQEEPFAGPGVFAQWRLMKEVQARGIKVVLDGQGGDELLCGYAKYFYFRLADLLGAGRYAGALASLMSLVADGGAHLFNLRGARRYLPGGGWLRRRQERLVRDDFLQQLGDDSLPRPQGSVAEQQVLDITTFGLPTLLRYEDKNSMAHGVESRVPLLDHRLVEFALSVPVEHKIQGARGKVMLRDALKGILPEAVRRRRSKLGFGGHWHLWAKDLRPELCRWVDQDRLEVDRFVRREAVKAMILKNDPDVFRVFILDRWLAREFPTT